MTVELIRSAALTDEVPYAYAAKVTAGHLVFTAGACPLDDDGVVGPVGDYAGPGRAGDGEPGRGTRRRRCPTRRTSPRARCTSPPPTVPTWSPSGTSYGARWATTTPRARCSPYPSSATRTSSSRWKRSRRSRADAGPLGSGRFPQAVAEPVDGWDLCCEQRPACLWGTRRNRQNVEPTPCAPGPRDIELLHALPPGERDRSATRRSARALVTHTHEGPCVCAGFLRRGAPAGSHPVSHYPGPGAPNRADPCGAAHPMPGRNPQVWSAPCG